MIYEQSIWTVLVLHLVYSWLSNVTFNCYFKLSALALIPNIFFWWTMDFFDESSLKNKKKIWFMVNKYRSTKMSNSLYEWHDLFSQNIFYLCVCLLQSINNNEILIHFETVRYPKHMVLWSYWHNGAIIYIASSGREVE